MGVEVYKQLVSASFDLSDLDMTVSVENLPFDWDYRHGSKDEVGAGEAARWLFENAAECKGKALTLRWVVVRPAKDEEPQDVVAGKD